MRGEGLNSRVSLLPIITAISTTPSRIVCHRFCTLQAVACGGSRWRFVLYKLDSFIAGYLLTITGQINFISQLSYPKKIHALCGAMHRRGEVDGKGQFSGISGKPYPHGLLIDSIIRQPVFLNGQPVRHLLH